jgi:tripartite-type tricarboxylate transporter receptor subunit TctC
MARLRRALSVPQQGGSAMNFPRRQFLRQFPQLVVAAASASALLRPASALDYPTRPVRVIVPFAAGGVGDIFARLIGQRLSDRLGKPFYVENQGGAGGNIGTGNAARAAPDGYTIALVTSTFLINPFLYEKVPYDSQKDFAPVTLAAYTPNALYVHPSLPVTTVGELVTLIRANPGKYSFGHSGIGTTPHLSSEIFKHSLELDVVSVPFNGAGPTIQSALGGHTPISFFTLAPGVPLVREGKLRALAVLSRTRSAALPDVPTILQAGYPGIEADTELYVLAPAGTPNDIIQRLHREIVQVIAATEMQERLATLGFVTVGNTPEEFGTYIKTELARWRRVIKETSIRAEP